MLQMLQQVAKERFAEGCGKRLARLSVAATTRLRHLVFMMLHFFPRSA